jgi:MFS family permease
MCVVKSDEGGATARRIIGCCLACATSWRECCAFGLMPNYLVDYLHLTAPQMGFVMSAIGFGGFVGQFGIPGLSDLFGRRIMAVVAFIGAAIFLRVFISTGANPTSLFAEHPVFGALVIGVFVCLILTETAPGKIGRHVARIVEFLDAGKPTMSQ